MEEKNRHDCEIIEKKGRERNVHNKEVPEIEMTNWNQKLKKCLA